jgi:hypothetical protein
MLVYGDQVRTAHAAVEIAELGRRIATLDAPGPPFERHARLAGLFIAASELAQGIADAAMARQGGDAPSPDQDAALALLMRLAQGLDASWRRREALVEGGDLQRRLDQLAAVAPAGPLQLKTAEGYAFYALYPEAYAEAARRLSVGADALVIGVRSIGLGLAAVAAVALGAEPPISVRPVGHPFDRQLQLTPALEARIRGRAHQPFVVVDEGPGLSGSSFGAVADALERLGVPPGRIAFLPGHGGDLGPQASAQHRARWAAAERPCVDFDALAGERLATWFSDLTGGEPGRIEDMSGGRWRAAVQPDEADWPAVDASKERRKFRLRSGDGASWLLKFAGLGATGERAFDHARRLGEAGLSPPALAFRHGVIATPWLDGAAPLRLRREDRLTFVAHLGRYLGWRAANLPAPPDAGATLPELLEMARVNAAEALGEGALAAPALQPGAWAAAGPLRRVWTDNRLHAHEWLTTPDGRWLKTDAVDHAGAHDLLGAQDSAWDVAGAEVEFDLSPDEAALLRRTLAEHAPIDPGLFRLLRPAYLAFQLGAWSMAADAHAGWPEEAARLRRVAARYRERLADCLR